MCFGQSQTQALGIFMCSSSDAQYAINLGHRSNIQGTERCSPKLAQAEVSDINFDLG